MIPYCIGAVFESMNKILSKMLPSRDVEDNDDQDQDDSSSHAQASKRSRIGSTANEMHVEEDDAETVIQDLLHENSSMYTKHRRI